MRIKLFGNYFNFRNFGEFFSIYKDIFFFGEYKFTPSRQSPMIIDCGTHIGIPVVYFKRKYPKAKIIAFEANPQTYEFLLKNIKDNAFTNVYPHNVAVAKKKGKINFYMGDSEKGTWSWGDSTVKNDWYSPDKYKTIRIPAVRLSSYITTGVDLLKLDVEGSELTVLEEIGEKLTLVKEMYIEFHGNDTNRKNNLQKLIALLQKKGFYLEIRHPYSIFHPKKRVVHLYSIPSLITPYFLIIHAVKERK